MKVTPISIIHHYLYNNVYKTTYSKQEETGKVEVKTEKFPLYNNKGELVHDRIGENLDIKA